VVRPWPSGWSRRRSRPRGEKVPGWKDFFSAVQLIVWPGVSWFTENGRKSPLPGVCAQESQGKLAALSRAQDTRPAARGNGQHRCRLHEVVRIVRCAEKTSGLVEGNAQHGSDNVVVGLVGVSMTMVPVRPERINWGVLKVMSSSPLPSWEAVTSTL